MKVPGDEVDCNVRYNKDKYQLGPITNTNIRQYLGEYSCTASHEDTDHTDTAITTISECSKSDHTLIPTVRMPSFNLLVCM